MEAIIFIWLILSALVGLWNYNRGNSFWLGFFGSALISPLIGFILVALTRKNPENIEKRRVTSGEVKKCSQCAEIIKIDAKKCRFCGAGQ